MQGEHNLPVCTLRTIFRASTCREGRVKEKLFRWFVKMGKKFGSEPCTRGLYSTVIVTGLKEI